MQGTLYACARRDDMASYWSTSLFWVFLSLAEEKKKKKVYKCFSSQVHVDFFEFFYLLCLIICSNTPSEVEDKVTAL